MPTRIDPVTGEQTEVSMEEFLEAMSQAGGQIEIQRVVTRADGSQEVTGISEDDAFWMNPGTPLQTNRLAEKDKKESRTEWEKRNNAWKKQKADREAREKAKEEETLRLEAKWKQDCKDWETECARIRNERIQAESRIREERRNDLLRRAREKRDVTVKRLDSEIAKSKEEKAQAESALAGLGFFQMSEKLANRKIITRLAKETLPKLEKQKQAAIDLCQEETGQVDRILNDQRTEIEQMAAQQIPMPSEPKKPWAVARLEEKRKPKLVLEALKKNGWMKMSEIMEKVPEVRDMGPDKLYNEILRTLYLNLQIEKKVEGRISYFKAK